MNKTYLSCALVFGASVFGGSLIQFSDAQVQRPTPFVAPAHAFGGLGDFKFAAAGGGGGGRYFTGSRRDGFTCGVCHASQKYFGMELSGFGDGPIEPGKTYTLTLTWEGDAKRVSFNSEVVGPKGFAAGDLALLNEDVGTLGDKEGKRQLLNVFMNEDSTKSEFEFKWTAPDKSFEGPISVHVAGVRFPEKDPKADPPPTALENTEQTIFSAVIPFGGGSSSKEAKQGDDE